MSVLCIDCGNTRVKWGLRQGNAWADRGALPLSELGGLAVPADRIVACNVAGDPPRLTLEAMAARLGLAVEWVHARSSQCGVTNGYEHPGQLGADRWAALIGARALHRGDCVVVMCGTATTIDLLTADGQFRGGLILPGLAMMRDALAGGTANLPTAAGNFAEQPRNTFNAIASGALQATAGAIERMYRQIANGRDPICLLSGGAAGGVSPRLTLPLRSVDNLVLEGLAAIAGGSENA
ncbi:MAG TPA: type III pantothenate kinase [Rhodocyclaceae bacterium]|nr:type III pantothenate kinase [Rhodocyclaceae bacterium]